MSDVNNTTQRDSLEVAGPVDDSIGWFILSMHFKTGELTENSSGFFDTPASQNEQNRMNGSPSPTGQEHACGYVYKKLNLLKGTDTQNLQHIQDFELYPEDR